MRHINPRFTYLLTYLTRKVSIDMNSHMKFRLNIITDSFTSLVSFVTTSMCFVNGPSFSDRSFSTRVFSCPDETLNVRRNTALITGSRNGHQI